VPVSWRSPCATLGIIQIINRFALPVSCPVQVQRYNCFIGLNLGFALAMADPFIISVAGIANELQCTTEPLL